MLFWNKEDNFVFLQIDDGIYTGITLNIILRLTTLNYTQYITNLNENDIHFNT